MNHMIAKHMTAADRLRVDVISEMNAMREIGMYVPNAALRRASRVDMAEYEGMKASEVADLLIDLAVAGCGG